MTLRERCMKIEVLLLDVDGVLTEGGIILTDDRTETKHFHVRDGLGIKAWQRRGKHVAILSGRASGATTIRAAELGIVPVLQGDSDKERGFREFLRNQQCRPEQICFVGDDVPDVAILREVGLAVAPADASPAAVRHAHYVTLAPGGRGAVREVIELILRCQEKWASVGA